VLAALVWRARAGPPTDRSQPSQAAQAAYAADPAARVTCRHLRPIENEAREQGVECLLSAPPPATIWIRALDPGPQAMAPLHLASCVRHEPSRVIGPHSWSDPTYRCIRCRGVIEFHQGGYSDDPEELRVRGRQEAGS
jgi:hypothetical protein